MAYRSRSDKYDNNRRRLSNIENQQKAIRERSYNEKKHQKRSMVQKNAVRKYGNIANLNKRRSKKRRAGSMRLVSCMILILACLVGGYFLSKSPLFNVTTIEVQGNQLVSAEDVISLSGLTKGINLFAEQTERAEQWLEINPYILQADVKHWIPGKLVITVEERQPAAIVVADNAFLTMAKDFTVLSRSKNLQEAGYPLLTGVDNLVSGVSPGSILEGEQVETGIDIINQMSTDVYEGISEINVHDPQKIRVFFNSGVEVRIGDSSDFTEKYNLFTQILADQEKEGNLASIEYIDVSILEKPVIFYYND